MPQAVFPENQAQLDALAELSVLFDRKGIEFWLRGGWGLDFLLGRETRPHGDLDLVVWSEARDILRPPLQKAGFGYRDRGFRAQMDFTHQNVKLSVVLLERQPNGDLTPLDCPALKWLPDALDSEQTLHGLTCRTLSPPQLIHEKHHYEGTNPLRTKDIESLRLLHSLVKQSAADGAAATDRRRSGWP